MTTTIKDERGEELRTFLRLTHAKRLGALNKHREEAICERQMYLRLKSKASASPSKEAARTVIEYYDTCIAGLDNLLMVTIAQAERNLKSIITAGNDLISLCEDTGKGYEALEVTLRGITER